MLIIYLLFKDGLLEGDLQKLIFHSQLGRIEEAILRNLELLGARVIKPLKDTSNRNVSQQKKAKTSNSNDETYELSRFVTALKSMLEDHVKGTLDPTVFPFVKAELGSQAALGIQENMSQASLRSAKPTWARTRLSVVEPKQRVIVFMAGGATYSESRACYEVSKASLRDVFLGSSHMFTPMSYLNQVSRLQESRRKLDLPYDRPRKEVPRHLLEPDPLPKPPPPPVQQQALPKAVQKPPPSPQPPTKELGGLKVSYNPHGGGRYAPDEKKKKKFGLF